ncbi:hypothetical protein FS749_005713 [Ceratobasidium sp. UAMH 11750]|nr:hypothetical protein FS749_005713 [Ceratobasidium sp. UAMH 11750]
MHCDMRMEDMDPVKWVVQSKNLRTVGFLSCNFPLPPSEQQQNYDNGEDSYDYYRPRSPVRHSVELPKAMREWLSERVGRVIVGDVPPTRIHDGVDLFVQELTSLG